VPNGTLKCVPPFDARQPSVDAIGGTETSIRCNEGGNENFGGGAALLFRYVIGIAKLGKSEESGAVIRTSFFLER